MGIREDLRKKSAQYLSMRNLLVGLSETEKITVQEAAKFLIGVLHDMDEPKFIRIDKYTQESGFASQQKFDLLLRMVADEGVVNWTNCAYGPEELDCHGWFRKEISAFLLICCGIDLLPPCCHPKWEPEVQQSTVPSDALGKVGVKKEKPLSTTERNSLLTIIAALCDYSAIKHQERGASSKIVNMVAEIGAEISPDTVLRVLEKIPEALESRTK